MNAQTVHIVDDDAAMRESLSVLLESEGLRVQAYPSAEACLAAGLERASGCLVVDIHMPGLTGLELQVELTRRCIALPVIVITGQGDIPKAVTALKAGAVDFLEKPYHAEALIGAVREALDIAGRRRQSNADAQDIGLRLARLSQREHQVMTLMVAGHPNKVIGLRLGISPRTVENHRASVMEKMQCDNLPTLIHLMVRHDRGGS